MPTLTSVNAQWTNGLAVGDADLRRINAGGLLGDGSTLGARGGIVRHGDNSLAVTVNGSDQIIVQPGVVAIPSSVALAGVYMAAFGSVTGPAAGTAIATRNATNPRIDLVIADTSAGVARIRTVDGTPSSSPVAPSLPAGSVELARLTVPATGGGAVTVVNTFRTYASALGGLLYVETSSQLPGSGMQKGQRAVAIDTGISHTWNGTTWIPSEGTYTPSITGVPTSGVSANYVRAGRLVSARFDAIVTGAATGQIFISLPFTAAITSVVGPTEIVGSGTIADTGTQFYVGVAIGLSAANAVSFYTATGVAAAAGVPHVWANTDRISGSFTYRAA